jgi:DNA-binding MarR family transcriptional regulator
MSSHGAPIPATTAKLYEDAPYVGALLRISYGVSRERSLLALFERGFTDLNPALLTAFFYPPPHGVRPIDLAENANMTKQAMNYLISQLEELGYMQRSAEKAGGRRLVYLTRRGWMVFETIWATQLQLQTEWAAKLGEKRFGEFMNMLRQLAGFDLRNNETKPPLPESVSRRPRKKQPTRRSSVSG